jgi:hypothetical protein
MQGLLPWVSALTGGIGLFLGILLGLNGFAQPATPTVLGQSPRIKNLIWLFGGAFAIFIADFKKLGVPSDFPWIYPLISYGLCALGGVVISVGWMCWSISVTVGNFNKQNLNTKLDADSFWREYLTYGKSRFEEKWRTDSAQAGNENKKRQLSLEADTEISKCIFATLAISKSEHPQTDMLIDTIMETAVSVVRLHTGIETVRASYMSYIPAAEAPDPVKKKALFTDGMNFPIQGYLELLRGGGVQAREVILPVFNDPEATLPGAPEAAKAFGVASMNIRHIDYPAKVSPAVRQQVQAHFRDQYFKPIEAVTSIAVYDGEALVGVLNIESSAKELSGNPLVGSQAVVGRLQILVALLSIIH